MVTVPLLETGSETNNDVGGIPPNCDVAPGYGE